MKGSRVVVGLAMGVIAACSNHYDLVPGPDAGPDAATPAETSSDAGNATANDAATDSGDAGCIDSPGTCIATFNSKQVDDCRNAELDCEQGCTSTSGSFPCNEGCSNAFLACRDSYEAACVACMQAGNLCNATKACANAEVN